MISVINFMLFIYLFPIVVYLFGARGLFGKEIKRINDDSEEYRLLERKENTGSKSYYKPFWYGMTIPILPSTSSSWLSSYRSYLI